MIEVHLTIEGRPYALRHWEAVPRTRDFVFLRGGNVTLQVRGAVWDEIAGGQRVILDCTVEKGKVEL